MNQDLKNPKNTHTYACTKLDYGIKFKLNGSWLTPIRVQQNILEYC